MADSAQVPVTATAAVLVTGGTPMASGSGPVGDNPSGAAWGARVLVSNTGANPVFLGGANVTAGNGWSLAAAGSVQLLLAQGEPLYGISAAGSTVQLLGTT